MNIARLNKIITIERTTAETDNCGNHTNSWKKYYSCHASISERDWASEKDAVGNTVEHPRVQITIRYSVLSSKITADKFRVKLDGNIYNITAVDHVYYQNKAIKLTCTKER